MVSLSNYSDVAISQPFYYVIPDLIGNPDLAPLPVSHFVKGGLRGIS